MAASRYEKDRDDMYGFIVLGFTSFVRNVQFHAMFPLLVPIRTDLDRIHKTLRDAGLNRNKMAVREAWSKASRILSLR